MYNLKTGKLRIGASLKTTQMGYECAQRWCTSLATRSIQMEARGHLPSLLALDSSSLPFLYFPLPFLSVSVTLSFYFWGQKNLRVYILSLVS